ncbi:hypothetical protein CRG98_010337 [Punica granatum]|uniref:Uncharacterized protein n=1 Tax=Punica granatum TaxID=22663 RepID=A0A2I0KLA0_PUNGR|nr:hypothetical protein CRG98_010337 [Punica granatum]
MELLKLSKFKLQLRALVSEARDLRVNLFRILSLSLSLSLSDRDRPRIAGERAVGKRAALHPVSGRIPCHSSTVNFFLTLGSDVINPQQKQKQTEEEYGRRVQELQAELASSDEIRRKLERQIGHLQDENVLLENKQKELNATIQGLVQSRDDFIYAYEESTCEMRRAIETRDRKLAMLSEKINSHLLLFDSIEKEALSVKQVVDNVKHVVSEKEELGMSDTIMDYKILSPIEMGRCHSRC